MAKSVLELAVGTGQWDAGLKKAKSALDNFTQSQGGLQQALDKESQKMQKFVQMMGGMESTAKTAKGQMNDYKSTIEQLTMQYNRMTEAQKKVIGQDYLQAIEQMKQKYQSVNEEIQEMNRSLNNVKLPDMKDGGGGLFGGGKLDGMLQVFGGNLMTKGAGMLAGLASEMGDMVKQGVELARQGEGIHIAFERLGRGDILDGLREATHGTVTDIELMKAAVKFNDFKLPLDELGTMLAFAQQKAKDTGQSVDYMVDSLVTGLGRKSLMILDNLGLSATEVKDRMKETGDMTKAVGAIIREQMAKAGDYVETAADRAAQANVSLQNKMEELGRKFGPVEEASNQLWTSMKIGILDIIGGPLATMLNQLTEAGRLKNALNNMNGVDGSGNTKVGQQLSALRGSNYKNAKYRSQLAQYDKQISTYQTMIDNGGKLPGAPAGSGKDVRWLQSQMDALKAMRSEYIQGAKEIMKPVETNIKTDKSEQNVKTLTAQLKELEKQRRNAVKKGDQEQVDTLTKQISQTKTNLGYLAPNAVKTNKTIKQDKDDFEEIVGLIPMAEEHVKSLQQQIRESMDEGEIVKLRPKLQDAEKKLQRLYDLGKEKPLETAIGTSIQNSAGISSYISDLQKQLSTADFGTSLYKGLSAQLADMTTLKNLVGESLKAGLGTAMFDAADATGKDFWTRAMEGGVENIDWQTIIDKINEARKAAGLDAISLDFTTGNITNNKGDKNGKRNKNQFLHENEDGKQEAKMTEVLGGLAGGMQQMVGGLEQLGIDIPAGLQNVVGGIQLVSTILTSIMTIVSAIEAISAADTIIPFANGGIVGRAAGGMLIPGNSFSGDNLRMPVVGGGMIGVNSGEVILNQAQAGVIANALEGGGLQNLNLTAILKGEDIELSLKHRSLRQGRGEYVTTRFK